VVEGRAEDAETKANLSLLVGISLTRGEIEVSKGLEPIVTGFEFLEETMGGLIFVEVGSFFASDAYE
jgi:hypothetical protein